jgi:hypothetical protein
LIFELDVLSILNLIFAGYTGMVKIKFEIDKKTTSKINFKNHFHELEISKSADS